MNFGEYRFGRTVAQPLTSVTRKPGFGASLQEISILKCSSS